MLEQALAGHEGGAGAVEHGLVYVAPSAMKDPAFVAQWQRRQPVDVVRPRGLEEAG